MTKQPDPAWNTPEHHETELNMEAPAVPSHHSDLARTTCYRHFVQQLADECDLPSATNPDNVLKEAIKTIKALRAAEFDDDED